MRSKNRDDSIKKIAVTAMISLFVAAFSWVGVLCFFFVDFSGGLKTIEIPDFVGLRFEDLVQAEGISIESEPVFSSDIPEGVVISQEPLGGAKRKIAEGESCTVRLIVSLGKETGSIPDLEKYKYTDAAAVLRTLGAKIRIVSIYDGAADSDTVLRTLPAAGERIEKGDRVTLFVSRKHARSAVCVRNFTGMPLDRAATEILSSGLSLGKVTEEWHIGATHGTVISQSIAEGSVVPYGSRIDIVVNKKVNEENLHPFRKRQIKENGEINGIY